MLENVTYNSPDQRQRISKLVGKPFGLRAKIKFGGIGSPKLRIMDCSTSVRDLLELDNNLDTCNIELRPTGIILRFRSLLETFAWIIPYGRLDVTRFGADYLLSDGEMEVRIGPGEQSVSRFFKRLIQMSGG